MARLGVTYEDVAKAAENILRQGMNPTMSGIRNALGETGSLSTISKHLNSWRSNRLTPAYKSDAQNSVASDEVNQAVSSILEKLNFQAQQQVETIRQESEVKIAEYLSQKQLAEKERDESAQHVEKLNRENNYLKTDLSLLQKKCNEAQHEKEMVLTRASAAENALEKMEQATAQHVTDLKNAYANNLQQLRQKYEKDLDDYKGLVEKQRVDFMVKLNELGTGKEKAEKSLLKVETELKHQQELNKSLLEKNKGLEVDLLVNRQQLADLSKASRK